MVIEFSGDTAEPRFDFGPADLDWRGFGPGTTIAFAAFGARGNDDAALETQRLRQFETAIRPDSIETTATFDDPLVPYPPSLEFPDADGIMFFITVTPVAAVDTQQVYGVKNGDFWGLLLERIKNNSFVDATGNFLDELDNLGRATFAAGTSTPTGAGDATPVNKFKGAYNNALVAETLSLSLASDPQTLQDAHRNQASQIASDINNNGASISIDPQVFQPPFPDPSVSALTFLRPA